MQAVKLILFHNIIHSVQCVCKHLHILTYAQKLYTIVSYPYETYTSAHVYGLHTFSVIYVHVLLYVNDWKRLNFTTNLITTSQHWTRRQHYAYGSTQLPQPSHSTPRWQNHTVQHHYHNPPTLHHGRKTIRFNAITATLPLYTTVAKS